MKKTIAAIALLASTTASAMPEPRNPETKISEHCLSLYQSKKDGAMYGGCDEKANNERLNRHLLANGCAKGQVALSFEGESTINSCLPPGVAQL